MAAFQGFNYESPQDVQERQRLEFLQGLQQFNHGDPLASLGFSLGSIAAKAIAKHTGHEDPTLQRAQELESRLKTFDKADWEPKQGQDLYEAELNRLTNLRNTVKDLDPKLASQVEARMLEVSQTLLERQKLKAGETRDELLFGPQFKQATAGAQKTEQDVAQGALEGVNYYNPKTGDRQNVTKLDEATRSKLRSLGYIEAAGPTTETEAGGLTKPARSQFEKTVMSADNQLDQFVASGNKFDQKWLEIPTQVAMAYAAGKERVSDKLLSVDERANLDKYTSFRRNTIDSFNQYIKSITGAAMSIKEAERIQKGFPDAEKDSATQFLAKTKETARQILQIRARASQALAQGLDVSGDDWDGISYPPISEDQVDTFMNKAYGVPLPKKQAAAPGAAAPVAIDRNALLDKYK